MDTASKERPSTVPIYSLRTVCARKRTAAHLASLLTNATHSDCRASVRERDGSPLRCYFGNMRGTRVAPSSMLLSYTQPSHDAPLRPITKDLHPPWVNVSALNLPSCLLQPIERKIPSKAFLHDHLTEVIGAYTSSISAYMPTSSSSSSTFSSATHILNMSGNNESAVASMKEEWHFQLSSLHSSTSQLKAHDIVWMRSLSAPSELLILCLSFICILLQLPPSWTSAKQSILSNGPLLLTFLSQVLHRLLYLKPSLIKT